jgi:azurin
VRLLALATALLASAATACSKTAELSLGSSGAAMTYDTTTLTVKAGQKVHLVFKNNAQPPVGNAMPMGHNWVLVKPTTENAVAVAAIQAGESAGFVPSVPDVLASTPQAMPGRSVEVTFTAPETPGSYPYICTNPGHAATMKGALSVVP